MTENVYESPSADLNDDNNAVVALGTKQVLFGFKGRIGRKTYWMHYLAVIVTLFVLVMIVGTVAATTGAASAEPGILSTVGIIMISLLYIPMIWILFALSVKRWHDRNKSGWWMLIGLLPLIGGIWVFIENGCLKGDEGTNNFGPPTF